MMGALPVGSNALIFAPALPRWRPETTAATVLSTVAYVITAPLVARAAGALLSLGPRRMTEGTAGRRAALATLHFLLFTELFRHALNPPCFRARPGGIVLVAAVALPQPATAQVAGRRRDRARPARDPA